MIVMHECSGMCNVDALNDTNRLSRWPLKEPFLEADEGEIGLTSESVEGASLPLEGIDDVHGGDGLPLGVLGVGDGVPDDVLKEDLEDSTGLLVDESRDTFHSTTTSETSNSWLGNSLDVVTKNLSVTFCTSFSQSLSSFSSSSHLELVRLA